MVARKINHSLHGVERYLQHFARVVFLAGRGFEPLQISSANVKTYLEIYQATRWQSRYADRYREIALIGDQHFSGEDQKRDLLRGRRGQTSPGGGHEQTFERADCHL